MTTLSPNTELTGSPRGPMATAAWRIVHRERETADTFTLALEAADADASTAGGAANTFLPGQFNMLYAFGIGEVPISMSGPPGDGGQVIHTIRAVGAVTRSIQALAVGEHLGLRGPYGTPWPLDAARGHDLLLIAGGIGLAPLRPALYHALAHRDDFGRVVLLYGTRSPDDVLFARELETWRGRFDLEVDLTVDRGGADWHGNVGVVTTLLPRSPCDPGNTVAFVCGPEVMMRFAVRDLRHRGLDADHIWVSLERNMRCGIGLCGHCQLGPHFVCTDGPVFRWDRIRPRLAVREL